MRTILRQLLLMLLYGMLGVLLAVIVGAVVYLEGRSDLESWHLVELTEEYRVDQPLQSFTDYLALEDRLFRELDSKLIIPIGSGSGNRLNRYDSASIASPTLWARNWNRSFELNAENPRAGVLMLHGMSDSPYSLRALAEHLHKQDVQVIGLRYPGHGSAPASLTRTTWEDMAGAVHLAARHLATRLDGQPLYVIGYSTGGPLALELALSATDDDSLPMPDGIVMLSPAMGVTALAALAPWQERIGRVLGLEKFAWNTLSLEYDPFKYRSFPLNAAIQVWRLSSHVAERLAVRAEQDGLAAIPPILTFQSVVDDTVAVPALLDVLYNKLPRGPHALVAYDINRRAGMEALLADDPGPALEALMADRSRSYDLALVTNDASMSGQVIYRFNQAGTAVDEICPMPERWPAGVYSLTHIALPFPSDDPLYGGEEALDYPGISLGNVVLRGEGSALRVSPAGFLRQTWNPFYPHQLALLRSFMGLEDRPPCLPAVPAAP